MWIRHLPFLNPCKECVSEPPWDPRQQRHVSVYVTSRVHVHVFGSNQSQVLAFGYPNPHCVPVRWSGVLALVFWGTLNL